VVHGIHADKSNRQVLSEQRCTQFFFKNSNH
jgi:hypothetical protein